MHISRVNNGGDIVLKEREEGYRQRFISRTSVVRTTLMGAEGSNLEVDAQFLKKIGSLLLVPASEAARGWVGDNAAKEELKGNVLSHYCSAPKAKKEFDSS